MDTQPVLLGDQVRDIPDRLGVVTKIIIPNSSFAHQIDVPDGGAWIDFEDGDCWLVSDFRMGEVVLEKRGDINKSIKIHSNGVMDLQ
jgi:hypothetical protein